MVIKSTVCWISGILLFGIILRFSIYNLAPLFMDTAFYASLGRSIAEGDVLLQVNHVSDKPPLFFYIQAIFFFFLGVSESVAAIPSIFGGMLGIVIIYLLGRDLHDSEAGIIAALLFAISPGSVFLSALGLIDSLFMSVVMLSFWSMLHRHYYWTGLLIGVAFGMKQTILSFGPLYLLWLLILEFHQYNGKISFFSLTKSILKMFPGFMVFFLSVLYWSIFLASDRLRLFRYVTSFVSGQGDSEFEGSSFERLTKLKGDLIYVSGLNWHWIIFFLFFAMIIFLLKLINQRRQQLSFQLKDKLHLGFILFTIFFFFILIFVARKYTGFHYVFPVFPFLIITASISLAQTTKIKIWSGKFAIHQNVKLSFLVLIVLLAVFLPATKKIEEIGKGLRNVPYKGAPEVVDELKTYITKEDSFLFEQNLGWMLRYYLFGEKYRRQHYDYKEKNMANMKAIMLKEPYTNFYVLFDRDHQNDIPRMESFLSPKYKMNNIFKSSGGNFKFFKIDPVISTERNNQKYLPEEWGAEWESWWMDIILSKWPDAKKIKINGKLDKTGKLLEINLFAEQVPFKQLVASEMEITIKSPKPNSLLSKFYSWPIFDEHLGITMQLVVNEETIESTIMERFKQVDKIEVNSSQSLTTIQAHGQIGERKIKVDTDFYLMLEKDFIRIAVHRFLLNDFDITWFTNLFKNHPIPPLKYNKIPSLDLELKNVKQQKGKITLDYYAMQRVKK